MTEPTRKVGRPSGEVTPESLIRAELIAHLKLYKKIREQVETRLETGTCDAEELSKYMELLRRGIVDMSKPFIAAARPDSARPAEVEEDGESILAKLLEGTRK